MRQRTVFTLVSATLILAGCAGWRRVPDVGTAPPRLASERPVRIRLIDGGTLVLAGPQVVGDSIIGTIGRTHARTAVALSAVRSLEERHRSGWRSAGAVVLVVVGVTVLVSIVVLGALVGNLGA